MLTTAQRFEWGAQLHRAGRLDEAEALFQGLLEEAPQDPRVLFALAVLVNQRGRPREAMDLLLRCRAAAGPHPGISSNLAAMALAAGALPEAVAHSREAIRLAPGLAVAHYNLGAALRRQGQLEEAESAFREARRLDPGDADAGWALGEVLARRGKLAEALACLEETVRRSPAHVEAQHELGNVLLTCDKPGAAVSHLREAIRLRPDFAGAFNTLGLALLDLDQTEEALRCYREAQRLDPSFVPAHNNLGNTLAALGQLDEALAEYQEALRLDPHNAPAVAALAKLADAGPYRFPEGDLPALAARAEQEGLPLDARQQLHFALATLADQAGDYPGAFAHYRRGNALRQELERRRGVAYDPEAQDRLVDGLMAACGPAFFDRARPLGRDTERPVFVVGMMRSGTSLAEQILASHPRARGAGELRALPALLEALPARLGVSDRYPEVLGRLDAAAAGWLAEGYERALAERGGAAARVVDKLPGNYLNLGLIAALFPRARIVHCRRDPLDTCLSCFCQNFGGPTPYTLDLAHLGHYYRSYARLMGHWAAVLPVEVFELGYEELVADQEGVSRRLLAFCGLDWDDRCLRFHETERAVYTASVLQVRRPLYGSSVGRWRRYEPFLQPLREALAGPGGEATP
jgi:tetratricopeptide (TPR) repeat protein